MEQFTPGARRADTGTAPALPRSAFAFFLLLWGESFFSPVIPGLFLFLYRFLYDPRRPGVTLFTSPPGRHPVEVSAGRRHLSRSNRTPGRLRRFFTSCGGADGRGIPIERVGPILARWRFRRSRRGQRALPRQDGVVVLVTRDLPQRALTSYARTTMLRTSVGHSRSASAMSPLPRWFATSRPAHCAGLSPGEHVGARACVCRDGSPVPMRLATFRSAPTRLITPTPRTCPCGQRRPLRRSRGA